MSYLNAYTANGLRTSGLTGSYLGSPMTGLSGLSTLPVTTSALALANPVFNGLNYSYGQPLVAENQRLNAVATNTVAQNNQLQNDNVVLEENNVTLSNSNLGLQEQNRNLTAENTDLRERVNELTALLE